MHIPLQFRKIPKRIIQFFLKPVRPMMDNMKYTVRSGYARGLKRRGGFAFIPSPKNKEDKFLENFLFKDKTIYDIGANIGMMSALFGSKCGENGFVYAFEPNPNSIPIIKDHLNINNLSNVKVYNLAIGEDSYESELVMHNKRRGSASINQEIKDTFIEKGDFEIFKIQVKPLDLVIEQDNLKKPDFIKIDTEGYEYHCLLGMKKILAEKKPDLYIEMHGVTEESKLQNTKKICELLFDYKYEIYNVEFDLFIKNNIEDAKHGHLFCSVN